MFFATQRSSFPICSFIILGNSTMFVYFFKTKCQHVLLLGAFQHVRLFSFFKIWLCSFIRYSFLCSFIRYLRVAQNTPGPWFVRFSLVRFSFVRSFKRYPKYLLRAYSFIGARNEHQWRQWAPMKAYSTNEGN